MKNISLLAALAVPAAALASTLDSARAGAELDFTRLQREPSSARAELAAQETPREPLLRPPLSPRPIAPADAPGAELARVKLGSQLDRNLYLLNYKLGSRPLDLGLATDAGFKNFYLTFSDRNGTTLGPLGDVDRLRGDGVDMRIDASTVYNFRVTANIFNPARGSTLHMTPAAGSSGPRHDVKTGSILDAARARAALVVIDGAEHWIYYGRDALPDGSAFAATRSFLIVREAGLSSKAWPLAEAALRTDVPSAVDLDGLKVWLTRTSADELIVRADR